MHRLFEVFALFLKLGLIAFGGPLAHLSFFQDEFVRRRAWLSDEEYADLLALCQFLPGPASSQVGFALGVKRAGVLGGFAAWLGFTLPSAVLMIGLAMGLAVLGDVRKAGWIVGLKLAAVAVVAHALWNMAAKLCPDRERALLALGAAAVLIITHNALWQVGVIVAGALGGWLLFRGKVPERSEHHSTGTAGAFGWLWLAVFFALLLGLPVLARLFLQPELSIGEGFYRAGSLVFGGGHVVLPLLESFTVGRAWIDRDTFLAGYGAAQALPGPLFAFTAFLGAALKVGPRGVLGGALALVATYLPAWLLVLGVLPYWDRLRRLQAAQAALMGANAVVVGLLLSAFYNPIWTAAVTTPGRLAFALVAFGALRFGRVPPWALVVISAGGGVFFF